MSIRRCRHCAHIGTAHELRRRIGRMARGRCSAWGCNCPGFEPTGGSAYCPTCGAKWAPEEAARAAEPTGDTDG